VKRVASRTLIALFSLTMAFGTACTTTVYVDREVSTTPDRAGATAGNDHQRWEEEARRHADELLEEARRLIAEGRT